MVSSKVLEELP